MFWQGWLVGNGIMRSVPLLPGQEGWVGAFSHKRLPGTGALLSAQGPTARLTLQVILRLPLTSSPHSQHRNNGAKGEGGTGESPGAPVLVEVSKSFCRALRGDKELATEMATIM